MIEKKLQAAADILPEAYADFSAVEKRIAEKAHRPRPVRRNRLAIAMVLAVLLVGCVAVSEPDYHLYNGNWWQFTPLGYDLTEIFKPEDNQTQSAANKLSITLPETLGGHPVIDFGRYCLTDQEVPIWLAWLSPRYVYHSSYYGIEMEEPWVDPNGIEGTRHWREGAEIFYGPIDDEIWRRQFGYDENGIFVAGNWKLANHPAEEITFFEYKNFTVYVGQINLFSREDPVWDVTWVDYDKGVVFSLEGEAQTPDTLIEYAMEIIDLNG